MTLTEIPDGGGRGGGVWGTPIYILAIRVCTARKGRVLKPFTLG